MKRVDIVCYTSKHCNLRCSYCYEHPLLADKSRMSLDQLERMFEHFAEFYATVEDEVEIRFQWHGGEPLLIEPEYYWKAFEMQRRIFSGSPHTLLNVVQSNMTVLDDARLDLLLNGFNETGVSLDIYSGLRVNKRGLCMENRSIANLDRALAAGLQPGGITVLTRPLLDRIPEVYRFWRERGMGFRVLPVEKGLYEAGQGFEINAHETLAALCTLADAFFADPEPVPVAPLMRHIFLLMHGRRSEAHRVGIYDKGEWESVVLVDTDGSTYGYANRFDAERSPGNIFDVPFSRLLKHDTHRVAAQEARARLDAACTGCEHLGKTCTGDPMAEGEMAFTDRDAQGKPQCIVTRGLLAHLERRLTEGGVIDSRTGMVAPSFAQQGAEAQA